MLSFANLRAANASALRAATFGAALLLTSVAAEATHNDVDRHTWQRFAEDTCAGGPASDCTVHVYTVPASRRVEVTSVSCRFNIADNGNLRVARLQIIRNNAIFGKDHFTPIATGQNGGGSTVFYAFNSETFLIGAAADELEIYVESSGADITRVDCKAAGELVTLQ